MVRIAPPPPERTPDPIVQILPAGTHLVRIYDPTSHGATAIGFRYYGPVSRFDHHGRDRRGRPTASRRRAIYYGSATLAGCLVELFGDTGFVEFGARRVAYARLTRDIALLDLCGHGAMRAGINTALTVYPRRRLTQDWSRCFYGRVDLYPPVDGLTWNSAHNGDVVYALYERAEDVLECPAARIIRLDDPDPRPLLLDLAAEHNLSVPPPD